MSYRPRESAAACESTQRPVIAWARYAWTPATFAVLATLSGSWSFSQAIL